MGAPSKLTPDTQALIVRFLASGCYLRTAAAAAGVQKQTLHEWLRKGAEQKSGRYVEFRAACDKAMADAEVRAVATIMKASHGSDEQSPDWRAAAWFLQHGRQKRWRDNHSLQITGSDGGPVRHQEAPVYDLSSLSDDELEAWEALLAKAAGVQAD